MISTVTQPPYAAVPPLPLPTKRINEALEFSASDVQRRLAEHAEAAEHRARHDAWVIHDLRQALDAERAQRGHQPSSDTVRELMALQEQLRHTSAFADQWRVRGAQLEEVIAEKDKVLKRREEENVKLLRELARAKLLPLDIEESQRAARADLAASERSHFRTKNELESANRLLASELESARADLASALEGALGVQSTMDEWRKASDSGGASSASEAVDDKAALLVEDLQDKVEAFKKGDDGALRGGIEWRGDKGFYL